MSIAKKNVSSGSALNIYLQNSTLHEVSDNVSGGSTRFHHFAGVAGVHAGTGDAAGVRLTAYGGGIEHLALAAADLLPHSGAAVAHIERVALHGVRRDNVIGGADYEMA
ncbi:hypothetical protein E2C01_038174 [Portunus trituberculatus]|uniref:Uncharacterized protein n=1 Tax=Portunus trituberculatus TaxID=210409 RepID=A0A5B7FBI7_PORTR|nr:hypothetical protein [Portunus trituberculatus]